MANLPAGFVKVVSALPSVLVPNTFYAVRVGAGFDYYLSDRTGTTAHKVNTNTDRQTFANMQMYNGLFYNGDFQTGTADNWNIGIHPSVTYRTDDYPFGSAGCLSCKGAYINMQTDEFIPVNPYHAYRMSAMFKYHSKVTAGIRAYAGFCMYDKDKELIQATNVMHMANTATTLASDLKVGDTEIHLTDLTPWVMSGHLHQRGIKFFEYKDSTGYKYKASVMPYTRYFKYPCWNNDAANFNKTTHKITLSSPWTYANPTRADGIWKAGTEVAQTNSGGTYNYCLLAGWMHGQTGSTEWIHREATIRGVAVDGSNLGSKFRAGTAFIKPLFLFNHSSGATQNDEVRVSGLWWEKV